MTLSKKDHQVRSRGIGSSEIGMIIYVDGKPLSRWGNRHKLWRRKTGREQWEPPKQHMRRGTYMEPAVLDYYAADHGVAWYKPPTVVHSDYPYVVDSVDGLAFPKGTSKSAMRSGRPLRCLEAKVLTGFNKEGFGEEGTDEIPEMYLVQCQWHIGAHKPEEMRCDFPVDVDGARKDYVVLHDEELYLALVSEAERFWQDYVIKDVEPPVDDHRDVVTWLSKYLKQRDGMGMLEADDDLTELMHLYRELALKVKEGEEKTDEVKHRLMRAIGEYDGIVIPGSKEKITWKHAKGRTTTDWRRVCDHLAQKLHVAGALTPEQYQDLKVEFSRTSEGGRRWVPTALLRAKHSGKVEA